MPDDQLYQGSIYVKKSPIHGYGVFAAQDFAKNQVIEECHFLLYDRDDDPLSNYAFEFDKKSAIPLGYGCIYNHSDRPNIQYQWNPKRNLIIFSTLRPIRAGEELLTSYGKEWFSSRKLHPRHTSLWQHIYYNGGKLCLRAGLVILAGFAFIQGLRLLAS